MLYFAYGSNLDPMRVIERIPGADPVCRAYLPGWRVAERLYADIERGGADDAAWGMVFEVDRRMLADLDWYEGHPATYRRERVGVVREDTGAEVGVWTYRMTAEARARRDGRPYPAWYRAMCSRGARAWRIPNAFDPAVAGRKGREGVEMERIIVYGTLLLGEANTMLTEACARKVEPVVFDGALYDTGLGYPAAVAGEGAGTVEAEAVEIDARDLRRFDAYEGYPRLYGRRRIRARRPDGTEVEGWMYEMRRIPDGATPIPSGSWRRRGEGRSARSA